MSGPEAETGTGRGAGTDRWSAVIGETRVADAARRLAVLAGSAAETRVRARYLELLAPKANEIIIDVGAGSGAITIDIARTVAPGGRVFAVDPSAGLLERARATSREAGVGHLVDTRVADGRSLPFGLAAFDAAFCHWVLLHVERPGAVIAEMKRVTRRGGRVLSVEADWETAMVQPGEAAVTRRILNHSADRNVDGWIGRRLAGLYDAAGFSQVTFEPVVLIDRGREDRVWLEYLLGRADIALEAGRIVRDEHTSWTVALEQAFAAGTFFFGLTQFMALGRVPA
jgi:ubiquinone/menaquinone biosynthesis C-methylase UbiE